MIKKGKNSWIGGVILLTAGIFFVGKCFGEKDMSMRMNEPHNIKGVFSYKQCFPDMNDVQLAEAQACGISPIATRDNAENMKNQLDEIMDCDHFQMDSLKHSIPFLVPAANQLLDCIGANFQDSLANKGLNPYKIIVTSVLRTQDDVQNLRRRNGNAHEFSAHCYGTTFDVSYNRFAQVQDPEGRQMQEVGKDTLKLVLSEVLRDLREKDKCYVKYELKQGCFHITVRKNS